jgi:hypothetical protein
LPRASALLDRAEGLLPGSPELQRLMTTAGSLLTTLDALLRDDARRGELAGDVADVRALVLDLRGLVRSASTALGDGRALKASLEALPPVLQKTAQVEDAVLQAELAAFIGEARGVLKRTSPLLDGLGAGPAGNADEQRRLVTQLVATLRSLDAAAVRADRLLGVVEARRGAAGRLFYDEGVADDLAGVLKALRADPLKFLLR